MAVERAQRERNKLTRERERKERDDALAKIKVGTASLLRDTSLHDTRLHAIREDTGAWDALVVFINV